MKKAFLFLGLLFMLVNVTYAQKFTATVNSNNLALGERFQVTFSLENANGTDFKAPSFRGFSVLSGPSQMHSTQIVNGQMSSAVSFTYLLLADKEGQYTIDPASIMVGGKRISSNSINVTVAKGRQQQGAQQAGRQGNQQGGGDAAMNKQAADIISKNLFIKLYISRNNVYMGEQITVTYKIFVHPELNIISMSSPKMPVFNGFWSNDINDPQKINWEKEVINGVPYKTLEVKKVVLQPQQSGTLKLDPMELDVVARLVVQNQQRRRRSIFDDFFDDPFFGGGYKDFPYTSRSNAGTITVRPLPPNAPATFNGAVGNLKLNAWLDKTQTKTNDPVTLKVQLSGSGNMKLIDPPALKLPPDIESFDPKTADNTNITPAGVTGSKTFEYVLIPRHSGEYRIDPVVFTFFNPDTKTYVTLSSNTFNLKVEKGPGGEGRGPLAGGVDKEDIKYIGKDIRFIKTSIDGRPGSRSGFFGSGLFFLFSLLPFIVFILFFIYYRNKRKLDEDQVLLKKQKANSVARKRLTQARKFMDDGSEARFYEEVSRALWGYLSHKLSIPFADLTKDKAAGEMGRRHVPEPVREKMLQAIDFSEFARFAPAADKQDMQSIYHDAVSAITEMEGCLK